MPTFWFVLLRCDIRVDNVMLRQIDTRVFHDFGEAEVLREFTWKEGTFEQLAQRGCDLGAGSPHISHETCGTHLLTQDDIKWRVMQSIPLVGHSAGDINGGPEHLTSKTQSNGEGGGGMQDDETMASAGRP